MASGGFRSAVLTPAFPALGRTVQDGELRVVGSKQTAGGCLTGMLSRAPSVKVSDAETNDDLLAIAQAALRERPVPLLAGSGGLAAALANVLADEQGRSVSQARVPRSNRPPWVIIGTDHPATLAQLDHLKRSGLSLMEVSALDATTSKQDSGLPTLLRIPLEHFNANTLQPLLDAIHHARAGSLVVSGGDTARLLCGAIEARAIRLGGEVLAGVPWGHIEGGCADGMTIVTKSGGFGEPGALTTVLAALWREGD